MKKIKYRNNNYNNQGYSINYKFDSSSPAGKFSGTALDLIKKYNELAKEAQSNGNYVEAEVFRQYAEHYRKIVTDINERKNARFAGKDNENAEQNKETSINENNQIDVAEAKINEENNDVSTDVAEQNIEAQKQDLVITKPKKTRKSFTVIEVSDESKKVRRSSTKQKKDNESIANG